MQKIWIDKQITYDGTQLRSRWVQGQTGITADVIAAFIGPADVPIENMVDLEDVAKNAPIFSKKMLHFIVEHFDCDLALAVARQRLLASIMVEELNFGIASAHIKRLGDDIYDGDKKLSVSIATSSPVSCLIHFAINILSEGTPVSTMGLYDYGIDPRSFADRINVRYCEEMESMDKAELKVRPVE